MAWLFGRFLGGYDTNFPFGSVPQQTPLPRAVFQTSLFARAVLRALLAHSRVLVRYRDKEPGCVGTLRISVGTKAEVDGILIAGWDGS